MDFLPGPHGGGALRIIRPEKCEEAALSVRSVNTCMHTPLQSSSERNIKDVVSVCDVKNSRPDEEDL